MIVKAKRNTFFAVRARSRCLLLLSSCNPHGNALLLFACYRRSPRVSELWLKAASKDLRPQLRRRFPRGAQRAAATLVDDAS
jgi:hypothetical protein